ncbi:recombination-associated protein RdgC [Pseudoxanthomonas winnipegensis]|uniref:recombination-associated protein RdgC n=1 Tax=Pseudoxanthomonas winnipegensis TaxID=2480810 RepID=UPI00102D7A7B|nr:recombination-associated protein RdgC [Pseudoxanthomonas winnipegensis]TAA42917.1 recombination-associated protein RdgC [Pseudoxanthomonas winnipegensis]
MFFRALTFYRYPHSLVLDQLDDGVRANWLKPVGALEFSSRGFTSPLGRDQEAPTHQCGDAIWLTLSGEDKLLPPAVIDKVLNERLEAIYRREGRRPGGRARKRLRDDVVAELLPGAFVKPSRLDALLDRRQAYIAVDTTSRRAAEGMVSEIRNALGSLPALPLNCEISPRSVLTGWLAGDQMPAGLALGEDCTLEDPIEGGGTVKCYRLELRGEEVAEHLEAGRQCTRLALVLDDHVSFDLDETMVVRKLRFLDGALESLESADAENALAELHARFALMAGELARLFAVLEQAFKLSEAV